MTDGHGDDLYKYDGRVKINFSSNIYANADLSALKEHLACRLSLIGSYPEPEPFSLERALAEISSVTPDEVVVTNGATEAIYLIARMYSRPVSGADYIHVIGHPTFSEYADACRMYGCRLGNGEPPSCGRYAVWRCNPNNPTGSVMSAADILETADCNPDTVFIIDQSYENYVEERLITDAEAVKRPNIILIHSMTKRFCIPGLRLGYVVANKQLASRLKQLRHAWSVNSLAIEAGLFLIRRGAGVLPDVSALLDEARWLFEHLNAIDGISVNPTRTNFMLARMEGRKAADLKTFLVDNYGMLIRDASNFEGLDDSCFRVAAQRRDENMALVDAIKTFMQQT